MIEISLVGLIIAITAMTAGLTLQIFSEWRRQQRRDSEQKGPFKRK